MWEYIICGGLLCCLYQCVCGANCHEEDQWDKRRRQRTSPLSPYSNLLADKLECVAENLEPSESYIKAVHNVAETIYQHLNQTGTPHGLTVVRYKVAGSVGKGTCITCKEENGDIVHPDLDLVLFLNNVKPPFQKELKLFAGLLADLDEVSGIIIRKFSVELKFWTPKFKDIKVDLLAAQNLVKDTYPWRKEDIGEVEAIIASSSLDAKQKEAICQTQSVDQEENKLLSSAFAEKTVSVLQGLVKDEYVLNVVRLAKYWNCSLDMSQYSYVPARSCIIELIAIHAQQTTTGNAEGREGRCIVSGFRRFLEHVAKFQTLDISLDKDAPNLENYNLPMVRDPVNGWNNLAQGIPDGAIKIWQKDAQLKLLQLEKLRNRSDINYNVENAIDCLFKEAK